jgi:hypothetical protein
MEKEQTHHTSKYSLFMSGEYCNSLNQEVLEMISNTKVCLGRLVTFLGVLSLHGQL